MNQPKRNLRIWIPIAAVLCFWLGNWMGHTYELTEGTTTHRLAAALNLNSLLLYPFRLSADAFSLGCGIAATLMAGLIYLCVKYSKHRLMPQKEYGSARWGGPEDIAPFLNENPQNNLPLTASESLSLSPKMKVTANDNYNRNKNVIVFGPSGSGKSYSVAGPQLLQFNSNYVLSDPKGELLQEYGDVLLSQGYKVKVFNLKDRDKSDHYNLFAYIKNEDDILVVTKNLVKNLKEDPTAKSTADPIWEEGMTALLEALIGYVFYELEPEERNMNSVMTLLLMLESQGDGPNSVSQLDLLFDDLSINKPNSFAAKQYKLYKMAPGKTAQSINVSLGLRMSAFNIPSIANICADDTIDLRELGSEKKVALFVVTPDTTTAYNFLAAVMFQQCFQILVDIADHRPDKRLPRHLRFLLDEFPNIGMIPDFQILISTIRSRDIACTLIYQSLNQLKSQYKDDWATIYENCDSMIVLGAGGNPENLEFFSKALGKASYTVWKEDGTHDVTVFFPIIFPDGATGSELSDLPEEYNAVADGKIKAADCTGNIVLDDSANLYKGELNDWFYTPDELTVTFTVVTGEGDDAVSDDYEVTFSNATAIPWCPGKLNDGQYGHYDLDCTIYLTGYDRYTDPETQAPNGADGGTGNLEALAESCDAGTLTRTIIKQDQYGNEYAGNAVSARYTKTITLPNDARGFQGWYKDGEDACGNVEWASLLYRMDWEELYGIVDGIKCRATGSGMTEEELRQLFASLNIDATTARGQVVAFALSCQGKFVYAQPSSLRGGPGNPSVGINLDCSSFVQYCYWAQNLPFSAGSTAAYRNAADLVSISPSEVQPGDLRVVYASGGEQGHVQMALGGGAWIECCYGYGVAVNMSNAWMESRPCYYFRYAGF